MRNIVAVFLQVPYLKKNQKMATFLQQQKVHDFKGG